MAPAKAAAADGRGCRQRAARRAQDSNFTRRDRGVGSVRRRATAPRRCAAQAAARAACARGPRPSSGPTAGRWGRHRRRRTAAPAARLGRPRPSSPPRANSWAGNPRRRAEQATTGAEEASATGRAPPCRTAGAAPAATARRRSPKALWLAASGESARGAGLWRARRPAGSLGVVEYSWARPLPLSVRPAPRRDARPRQPWRKPWGASPQDGPQRVGAAHVGRSAHA